MPSVDVLTNRYDVARSSANLSETQLNTANVNVFQFGKLFSHPVDGDIYAQPLVVNGVQLPGVGARNVVYAATASNSLFAFDADGPSPTPYWHVGPSVLGQPVPVADVYPNYHDFQKTVGITSTPVIDLNTRTIYVLAKSLLPTGQAHHIHAFHIETGANRADFNSPIQVAASVTAPGGARVDFDPNQQLNRPGLLLLNGVLYVAFGSHGDHGTYHGWVLAYDALTLQQTAAFCSTPGGGMGGIWHSGSGLASDGRYVYAVSGNGDFGNVNFGNCIVRLDPQAGLAVDAWYHVPDVNGAIADLDLSTGPVVLAGSPASLVVAGSKEGKCFFVDPSQVDVNKQARQVQVLQASVTFDQAYESNLHGAPLFWRDRMYSWGEYDYLRCHQQQGGQYSFSMASAMHAPPGMPGAMLTVTADGATPGSGVVWASMPYRQNANQATVDGILRAFDATDVSVELWNSRRNAARDDSGKFAKFCPPAVANGRVYLATFSDPASSAPNFLHVYGLLPGAHPPPARRWLQTDVGTPIVGSLGLTSGRAIIRAAGADIEGFADSFHFVYVRVSGDVSISARVRGMDGSTPNEWAKAGVMIRDGLEAWSAHAMMVMTPRHGAAFQRRVAVSTSLKHTPGPAVPPPYWVRIERSGGTFTGSASGDGQTWTVVGSETIAMPPSLTVGFAVTAHNDSLADPLPLVTATFDSVASVPPLP